MGRSSGLGPSKGLGWKNSSQMRMPYLSRELVEVLAGGLADPVADEVEVGELMHVDFGVEALARDALEGFVEAPVAAADEDGDAVDGDGEGVGAGNGVRELADAEGDVLRVGGSRILVEREMELVEVLRAVTVGPPEARVLDVQRGIGLRGEGDGLARVGSELNRTAEGDVLDAALERAFLRLIGDVLDRDLDGNVA